ncbi:ubiquitin-like protein 7 [Chanos chanos]|uniref:Ubiquitin-like protein 7 n=1 Tax=Chanos chanos TaxID=29144 RepID=A0A6J2URH5_CHACN|nr:ubiquitin-like protein 7 [Chanos chanos]
MREMASSEWHLSLKLTGKPKSVFQFPEMGPGDVSPGSYTVSTVKQLVSAQLSDSLPDAELIDLVHCGCKLKDDLTLDSYGIKSGSTLHILKKSWPEPMVTPEPIDRTTAAREFRVLQNALHNSAAYRDTVFKMLNNKESLEQIIVASPGVSSDPVALGVLQDKDLFVQFADPKMLDMLIGSHPALVNAIILVLHSATGSMSSQHSSSRNNVSSGSFPEMPGGFLFEGLSDDEEDSQANLAGTSRGQRAPTGSRPMSLGQSGATGPRPITQSELAAALALASSPDSTAVSPPRQETSSSGNTVSTDLFNQALRQALQVTPAAPQVSSRWQSQLQQLRDMGIQDEELMLRALQAANGNLQAALDIIFSGGGGV